MPTDLRPDYGAADAWNRLHLVVASPEPDLRELLNAIVRFRQPTGARALRSPGLPHPQRHLGNQHAHLLAAAWTWALHPVLHPGADPRRTG